MASEFRPLNRSDGKIHSLTLVAARITEWKESNRFPGFLAFELIHPGLRLSAPLAPGQIGLNAMARRVLSPRVRKNTTADARTAEGQSRRVHQEPVRQGGLEDCDEFAQLSSLDRRPGTRRPLHPRAGSQPLCRAWVLRLRADWLRLDPGKQIGR